MWLGDIMIVAGDLIPIAILESVFYSDGRRSYKLGSFDLLKIERVDGEYIEVPYSSHLGQKHVAHFSEFMPQTRTLLNHSLGPYGHQLIMLRVGSANSLFLKESKEFLDQYFEYNDWLNRIAKPLKDAGIKIPDIFLNTKGI